MDQLTQDKEKLENELVFKERTLQVMSKDLVNEREARQTISKELAKLRKENMDLKQEIVLAREEQLQIQNRLKEAMNEKVDLEKRVSQVEKILKEKSLMFQQLKEELARALKGTKEEEPAVQLPPIVVKPKDSSTKEKVSQAQVSSSVPSTFSPLKGSILAVNEKERFVVIDLGQSSGVKVGSKFDVFRGKSLIGSIEVVEAREEISAADIKDVVKGYSLKEGDLVVSK